jgi:DNA-binding MarR family transcriptional regulator
MQVGAASVIADQFDELVRRSIPRRRGLKAWEILLRAHATLVRQLELEIAEETGVTLGDFDVMGQLAQAGGELRMSDLARRAFSSRSGLTRRIDRLVDEGLVRRSGAEGDGRGVMVALTKAGQKRLSKILPVHLRGVAKHFVSQLDDEELSSLERALTKVIVDCEFG